MTKDRRIDPFVNGFLEHPELSYEVREQVDLQIEYEGYIARQLMEIEHVQKLEEKIAELK
mgnify:FL=1